MSDDSLAKERGACRAIISLFVVSLLACACNSLLNNEEKIVAVAPPSETANECESDCDNVDCEGRACADDPAFICCSGSCVDTLTDEQHFHGCDMQVARPEKTEEAQPVRNGCTYIQFCMKPGTVCRVKDECDFDADANADECISDAKQVPCDLQDPFWLCDRGSVNCRLLERPK